VFVDHVARAGDAYACGRIAGYGSDAMVVSLAFAHSQPLLVAGTERGAIRVCCPSRGSVQWSGVGRAII
jgi:hypothetical protein